METSQLTDATLDWVVAKCERVALVLAPFTGAKNFVILGQNMAPTTSTYEPSRYWSQGGPIIERERIQTYASDSQWTASDFTGKYQGFGDTPLIAAMRCYVASKLGNNVDVPEELI